jgi:hypothetical protein
VSWWPGDGAANDQVDGNHGTLMNGTTYALGMVGQAFGFDGTDDYVAIPNGIIPSTQRNFTLDAWVYPNNIDNNVIFYSGTGGEYQLDIGGGNFRFCILLTNGTWYCASSSPTSGNWVHLAGVRRDTSVELWVNGVLMSTVADPSLNLQSPSGYNSSLGAYNRGARFWNGRIDEVELFTRALSQTEIQSIYNAGAAGKCKSQQTPMIKRQSRYSLAPLASTNIAKAKTLLTEANDLMQQAQSKGADTGNCAKLIDEANEYLEKATKFKASPVTANYFALKAVGKFAHAIECLKALLG